MQSCEIFLTFLFVNFYFKDSKKNIILISLWIKRMGLSIFNVLIKVDRYKP